ncbi:MAG: 5,10-methylenetetrahydrofolate reductase [Candidatus Omnitrophica bacterium CG07_land_8_20_14_0_80_42_15]|uniref:5,10-methylenetetrahydrofolate reductase n=1 Tax=Candidatus Aquitaenariimonas noxiae TaxID=1974741 RepID=A0A2J0KSR1_9BACT|nr:MAG: 5,10-methylenetetrahydrofolate reductase [Candidatus Omnitrophica bacterium CG07_land_8_20_14_0_80_42_15]
MIITKQKDLKELLDYVGDEKVFIVGCGECAETCRTGGEREVLKVKEELEKAGKTVTGWIVPEAPCVAAKIKIDLAKNMNAVKSADSILVMACGLGIQSVKENDRFGKKVHPGCDTMFMGEINAKGEFFEACSACGECILELTGGICPVTRCAKGILNGPCGGQNKGKCEVDKEKDCAWVLIYEELKKRGRLDMLKNYNKPKDYSKMNRPNRLILANP